MKVSILVVDGYAVVRRGLQVLLESHPGWSVVATAKDGHEGVAEAIRLQPDVVILDVSLARLNGLDVVRQILKDLPETRILVLTEHNSGEMIEKALQAGVRGYVLKSDAESDLIAAVTALMQGQTFFTPAASEVVVKRLRRGEAGEMGESGLTVREVQIVQLLAEGNSNKEAANVLGISARTVENHRAQIMQRLGLKSFPELIRYAVRNGIIEP